jgi:hypothetical protein
MSPHKDNFNLWFRKVIENIYENENAGFPLLMLTFPLLERYLRSKSEIFDSPTLGEPFFKALLNLFPVLRNTEIARKFWQVYRNGILHQATLSQRKNNDIKMPDGGLSGDKNYIEIDQSGAFWVNPVEFAKRVIDTIDKDFSNFEARSNSNHPLATAQKAPDGFNATCGESVRWTPSLKR